MTLVRRSPSAAFCRVAARLAIATVFALVLSVDSASAQVRASYLYTLSNFSGRIPYNWARIHVDQERAEIYVVYGTLVRIFNASGMEVFSFGDGLSLGAIFDVAVDDRGDIILLSFKDSKPLLTRCDFKGVPRGTIEITNLPVGVEFSANRMLFRNGRFYFASMNTGSITITDADGKCLEHTALLARVDADEQKKADAEITGFTVDRDGNIFFTVPVLFRVFKYAPDKTLTSFGRPGSAPGRFGVIAGVATDSHGNVLVTDRLKCVVAVFDKDFKFITDFGRRGPKPDNLIVPDDISLDRQDRVYVAQSRKRGVNVYALNYD